MKKIIALLLALAMLLTLAGCSSKDEKPEEITTEDTGATTETTTEATEPEKVEMSATDLAAYVEKSTVTVTVEGADFESTGSGFFIDDEGTVVTSYHVIDGADSISVEVADGGRYDVTQIVDFSELYDIAVLKLDYSGHAHLEIGEEAPKTGETVYAVGSSLGFLNGTFSNGIISSVSRNVGSISCIQTTAAISNGNSGGPLVNAYGEVIGINAFVYNGGENLSLAVKIGELEKLSMDKNWSLSRYREWYKKEIERSYKVYNYIDQEFQLSKIHTYQHETERECMASAWDWEFLDGNFDNVVDGYDVAYGLFIYEYKVAEFDKYTEYLNSVGFSFLTSEDYNEGTSYFYYNEFSGEKVDIFIVKGDELMVIEPYIE